MASTYQPAQPPPPPKKSNVLLWVLVGVGGFFLLLALIVVVGIAYVARNPALVMTKVITASNPNVEVITVNKGSQQITLRDKKTGETYNISFDDVKNGRISMKGSNGRASFSIGGGAKVPAWVPEYPGSDPQSAFSAQGRDGASGTFTFKTPDPADKVTRFYQDQLQVSGLHITSSRFSFTANEDAHGSSGVLVAEDDAKKHTVTVIIGVDGRNTTVAVTYANK
jgi:hypothetical protein